MANAPHPHTEAVRQTNNVIAQVIASMKEGPKFMEEAVSERTRARRERIENAPTSVQGLLAQGYTQDFVHRLAKLIEGAGAPRPIPSGPVQSPDARDRNWAYMPTGQDIQELPEPWPTPFRSSYQGVPQPYLYNEFKPSSPVFQFPEGYEYPDDGFLPGDPHNRAEQRG